MLWCSAAASTWLVAGGAENALELGTMRAEELHERMFAYWLPDGDDPAPGDVVFLSRDRGRAWHCGLVETFTPDDRLPLLTTIEGNAGNAVTRRTYATRAAGIRGYARPKLIGPCGALPPASGTWAPCSLDAGHSLVCVLGRDFRPENAPRLVAPVHPQQGRALKFLRLEAGLAVDACAARFGLTPGAWFDLEHGILGLAAADFARVCRGLAG
jgi:hypothetical protein